MKEFHTINPFHQSPIKSFQKHDISIVNELIETTHQSFLDQKNLDISIRGDRLMALSKLLEKNKQVLGELMTKEMGKPVNQAISEVEKCIWVCEYYVENAVKFLSPKTIETEAYESYVTYEPLGVILAIMPWNFPLWQVFRFLAPALMIGNTVLLKHAPNVLGTALRLQGLVDQAGFDKGTLQNLIIDVALVEKVISHKYVKGVTLTGSETAGQSVAEIAGKNLKKCVLELGGSNAFIVHQDAQIDKAVEIGVQARMQNNGQSCIAAKRFIIHNSIFEEYLERYKNVLKSLKCGDPMLESTDIGPLARPDLADKLETQVKKSIKAGAKLVMGGQREGALYYPTILASVKPGMPAFDEELFGPVSSFIGYNHIEEAVSLSNLSTFGLGVSIFTQNLDLAKSLISKFEDGAVFINELVKSDPRLPFGGTKRSGYGRELSLDGLREFVNIKTVYITKLDK